MTIWEYQRLLINRLLQWSLLSLGFGAVFILGRRFWRDIGKQFIGWALVNMGIAYIGIRLSSQRRAEFANPDAPEALKAETQNLRHLLEVNTIIDLGYMFFGRWLIRRGSPGTGWGILIQGVALFIFDLFHAGNTPALPSATPAAAETPPPRKRAPRKRSTGTTAAKSSGKTTDAP